MNELCLKRLQQFNICTPPAFSQERILLWQDLAFHEIKPYAIEEQRYGSASVNVFRVVGTRHPSYAGGSWYDLLGKGVRMDQNLALFRDNPGYYLETGPKEPYMQYVSLDGGDMYVGDEGNHRSCIARYYFSTQGLTMLHGVTLLDYRIDWAFKSLCDEFLQTVQQKRLPIYLTVERKMVERRDATDWKLDKYTLTGRVVDARTRETHNLDFEGLYCFLEKLKRPWWKIWGAAAGSSVGGFAEKKKRVSSAVVAPEIMTPPGAVNIP